MATSNITNQAVGVTSAFTVTAILRPSPGFRISNSTEIVSVSTVSDSSGNWTLALERQSNINPSDSWWEIEEAVSATDGGSRVWAISVGNADATLLASLISPISTGAFSNYLTQAAADARYLGIGSAVGGLGTNITSSPFNCVADSGTTNNLSGLQAAIAATPAGGTVLVPTGAGGNYYQVNGASSGGTVLSITKDITIQGQSGTDTKLKFGPESPTGTLSGFVVSDGVTLTLQDVNLEGPNASNGHVQIAVLAGAATGNTASTVKMRRCTLTKWPQGIKGQGDYTVSTVNNTVEIYESSITSSPSTGPSAGNCVLMVGGGTLKARHSTFDMVPASTTASGQCHNFYLYYGTALDVDDCQFVNADGYNAQYSDTRTNVSAAYARILNSEFIGTSTALTAGVLTHPYSITEIRNCRFDQAAPSVNLQNDVEMSNCLITNSAGSVQSFGSNPGLVRIDGVRSESFFNNNGPANQTWWLTDCQVDAGAVSQALHASTAATGGVFYVRGGTYSANTVSQVIRATTGTWHISGCAINNGAPASSIWGIEVDGAVVEGEEITFQDPNNGVRFASGQCHIRAKRDLQTTVIAATSQTVLDVNHNAFHLGGTGTVLNLWWQSTTANFNTGVCGPLELIHDSSSAVASGGNCVPATTAARTAGSKSQWYSDPAGGANGLFTETGAR